MSNILTGVLRPSLSTVQTSMDSSAISPKNYAYTIVSNIGRIQECLYVAMDVVSKRWFYEEDKYCQWFGYLYGI